MPKIDLQEGSGHKRLHNPIRLTVTRACNELQFTGNKIKGALQRAGYAPGPDGKFSLKQVFTALSGNPIEQKAKDARWEGVMAEADLKKLRYQEARAKLVPREEAARYIDHIQITLKERIRHWHNIPKADQLDLIKSIEAIERPF
jgi:hypothetical protein